MWQDLYPEKYDSWLNTRVNRPTYANPQPDTGLAPFHMDAKGTPYKSVNCSKPKQLGYTYPELQTWLAKYKTNGVFDAPKYKAALKADIELKYSTTGKSALLLAENEDVATVHLSNMTAENLEIENFPPVLAAKMSEVKSAHPEPIEPLGQESWKQNDYIFNVVYDRYVCAFHLAFIWRLSLLRQVCSRRLSLQHPRLLGRCTSRRNLTVRGDSHPAWTGVQLQRPH